ncbi:MAG: class I SAM-dependent methyltransferase [Phaeodactylibacter sp.]|nr:class I SAM-dependent methyltransferase [Phaeodactylibacter sp.]
MKLPKGLQLLFLLVFALSYSACIDSNGGDETVEPLPGGTQTVGQKKNNNSSDTTSFEDLVKSYERADRLFWQKPDLVIDRLGDISQSTIADIGAGSGYFARRLAHKAKRVIAIDIDEQFIEFMDSIKLVELPKEIQGRFETRLATPTDPKLHDNEVDVVLIVNTYMLMSDRIDYLRRLKQGLKPGGRLVIVDYKKKRIALANPPQSIRLPLYQVENELDEAGYRLIDSDDTSLDYQYIVMAGV